MKSRKQQLINASFSHKKRSQLLRSYLETNKDTYLRDYEKQSDLPPLTNNFEAISNRYHYHLRAAGLFLKEHNLLPKVTTQDTPSNTPFLPIAIYLDHLRSAHNVGSIIRTTEALRLGTIYFSPSTPFTDNKKVNDAAMGSIPHVPCKQAHSIQDLPRPLIALETILDAPSLYDFTFPEAFTLLLGNEEYGLSQESLKEADMHIQIPLLGTKNSLNVACAYAMAAGEIYNQLGKKHAKT